MESEQVEFSILKGKIFTKIEVFTESLEYNDIDFYCDDGSLYKLYHEQEYCEYVYIEDICGDIDDLLYSTILVAEEVINKDENDEFTWYFYKLDTIKVGITIRWCGESNGYYSERATLKKIR